MLRLSLRLALGVAVLLLTGACRIAPPLVVGGEIVWSPVDPAPGPGKDELLAVSSGEIVRFESNVPIRVGQVVKTREGEATIWETLVPKDGVALVRTGLFTSALRASHDVFRSAHSGEARKPEFAWFELESKAIAWADSPLGTPFPSLSAAPRFDPVGFAELDEILANTFRNASDRALARDVTHAVRAVVALRAVHTLEGLRGFPYALNRDLDLIGAAAPRTIDTRRYVLADPAKGVPVHVSGPIELFVWARVARTKADEEVEVRVTEAGRLRGSTKGLVRREVDRDVPEGSELSQLRHVIVDVPPGDHDYLIEPQAAPAMVSAEVSQPAQRLEHVLASTWHETSMLEQGKRACGDAALGPACALVLALAGEEGRPQFARALQSGDALLSRVTGRLAQGGSADLAASLEGRAMAGDVAAEEAIAAEVRDTVDASYHDAWKRTTLRTTAWEPLPGPKGEAKWAVSEASKTGGASCGDRASGEREIGSTVTTLHTSPWRRAHVLELVAVAPCSGDPLRLEVDGQELVAQPSSARAVLHVVVKGETAEVRRIDQGPGQVFALTADDACGAATEKVLAPDVLSEPRTFAFPKDVTAPGLEIWQAEGKGGGSLTVHSVDGRDVIRIDVEPKLAPRGIDEHGQAWRRSARVPLPEWATSGIVVEGGDTLAVRPLTRQVRPPVTKPVTASVADDVTPADPPNEAAVVDLSRRIVAATDARVRAGLLQKRALLLASYGAHVAATADAEAATALGGTGEAGEDIVGAVRRAIRPVAPRRVALRTAAYGLDPDFDAHAPRCAKEKEGARVEIGKLEALLHDRSSDAPFDPALATRVVRAVEAAPDDPRAPSLEQAALRNSRWQIARNVKGGAGHVPRPFANTRDPLFDPEGRLRPDVAAGRPFGEDYVVVTPDSPARALLTRGGPKLRLDVACVARNPRSVAASCPFTYAIGQAPGHVQAIGAGVVPVPIPDPPTRGRQELVLSLPAGQEDYVALVRIVYDRPIEGTVHDAVVGWVLQTPHTQHRTRVTPGRPARLDGGGPRVLRVDARSEPGGGAEVVVRVDGRDLAVPVDGEPIVVAATTGEPAQVSVRSGSATVDIAERIPTAPSTEAVVVKAAPLPIVPTALTLGFSTGRWPEVARRSPRPLTPTEDRLGTFESDTGVAAATLREGATGATGVDAYGFEELYYRRRIEAPNLYTVIGATARLRDGPATTGAELGFYEDLDRYRLRITGTANGYTQSVQGTSVYTLEAKGFLEYSGRIRPDFFILPRLGYDGNYTTLGAPPPTTVNIDDDVYDPFRYVRRTFLFLQGLFWYCPHFNDIYYLRVRADYDATNSSFSHASVLPGMLLIFHQAELTLFANAEYFEATPLVRSTAGVDVSAGEQFIWHAVVVPGSFEFRPTLSSEIRLNDASWQLSAGVNILFGIRRGQRDYSSLELSFPEETAGGIPWRTETRVGP